MSVHVRLQRLTELHEEYRDQGYEIRIIGHSLGGGVGALLAMLLNRIPHFADHGAPLPVGCPKSVGGGSKHEQRGQLEGNHT